MLSKKSYKIVNTEIVFVKKMIFFLQIKKKER